MSATTRMMNASQIRLNNATMSTKANVFGACSETSLESVARPASQGNLVKILAKQFEDGCQSIANSKPQTQGRERVKIIAGKYAVLNNFRPRYEGPNSMVEYARDRDNNEIVVLKRITRKDRSEESVEVENLKIVKGEKSFIQLINVEYTPTYCYIVLEFPGEQWITLFDYIETSKPLSYSVVRKIFVQIVAALKRLELLGYAHGDVKDENVLVNSDTLEIKVIDLGAMTKLEKLPIFNFYGTLKYASPEVYNLPEFTEKCENLLDEEVSDIVFSDDGSDSDCSSCSSEDETEDFENEESENVSINISRENCDDENDGEHLELHDFGLDTHEDGGANLENDASDSQSFDNSSDVNFKNSDTEGIMQLTKTEISINIQKLGIESLPKKFNGVNESGEITDINSAEIKSIVGFNQAEVESWTLGTLLFGMFFGIDIFSSRKETLHADFEQRIKDIRGRKVNVAITDSSANLMIKLLARNPQSRPSLDEILDSEFCQELNILEFMKENTIAHLTNVHSSISPVDSNALSSVTLTTMNTAQSSSSKVKFINKLAEKIGGLQRKFMNLWNRKSNLQPVKSLGLKIKISYVAETIEPAIIFHIPNEAKIKKSWRKTFFGWIGNRRV